DRRLRSWISIRLPSDHVEPGSSASTPKERTTVAKPWSTVMAPCHCRGRSTLRPHSTRKWTVGSAKAGALKTNKQTIQLAQRIQRTSIAIGAHFNRSAKADDSRRAIALAMFGLPCPTMKGPAWSRFKGEKLPKLRYRKREADYRVPPSSNPYRIKTLRQMT